MKDKEFISGKVFEGLIYLAALWASGDLAQAIYQWTYLGSRLDYSPGLSGFQALAYHMIRGGVLTLIVQAAARRLTDSERSQSGGRILWFEPWRMAQAVVCGSFITSWAYWAASQLTRETAKSVEYQPAHPGVIAISGLIVLSCLAWPTLFRLMEPEQHPSPPESEV